MARIVVLVDGFNLYHGLREAHGRRFHWLDLGDLARQLRPQDQILQVRYFTARVLDDPAAEGRQRTYIQALQARNGIGLTVVNGRYQRKQVHCRCGCGANWTSYEEKETDVNIAVSLVETAAAGVADSVMIISADSDLCPAVRSARNVNPALTMIAAFPPRRHSAELKRLVNSAFQIGRGRIKSAQMPDTVHDPSTGTTLRRPEHWK